MEKILKKQLPKRPPHPCPHLYAQQFATPVCPAKYHKKYWYHSGTIVNWTDGLKTFRGLVRGDGLILSMDELKYMQQSEAYMGPNKATIELRPCKRTKPWFWEAHAGSTLVSGVDETGSDKAPFLRGVTSDGWYRYEE